MSLLGIVVIVLLVVALLHGFPDRGAGPYYGTGYYLGGGTLGIVLVVVLILALLGRF